MIGWMFDQAAAWLAAFVADSLNAIWALLAATLFHLPDVTGLPQVAAVSARALAVVNTAFVLAIMTVGIVVMTRHTVQAQYGAAELAPRLVIGLVAANFATEICRAIITTANAVVEALTGDGIASTASLSQLLRVVTGALSDPAAALLTTLVALIIVILLALLLVGWIARFAALIVTVGVAPAALACHALPWTEAIAADLVADHGRVGRDRRPAGRRPAHLAGDLPRPGREPARLRPPERPDRPVEPDRHRGPALGHRPHPRPGPPPPHPRRHPTQPGRHRRPVRRRPPTHPRPRPGPVPRPRRGGRGWAGRPGTPRGGSPGTPPPGPSRPSGPAGGGPRRPLPPRPTAPRPGARPGTGRRPAAPAAPAGSPRLSPGQPAAPPTSPTSRPGPATPRTSRAPRVPRPVPARPVPSPTPARTPPRRTR